MIRNRLELALQQLPPSDWKRFEELSSAFLASEFDTLRTVACSSGDEGRDAELFSPAGEEKVVFQFSVVVDWRAKINATVRRLQSVSSRPNVLIYLTNQVIGAEADSLKKSLRTKHGLSLDIRDRNWFLERVLKSTSTQQAAEDLARVVVDPFLASVGVGPHVKEDLSSIEAIAAVTFLSLRWQDDTREKGLTKLAFEALVRAALINSDSQNRVSRSVICEHVESLLPGHNAAQIRLLANGSLGRLTKKNCLKHWSREDKFCLSNSEVQRFEEFRVQAALAESNLVSSIEKIANALLLPVAVAQSHAPALTQVARTATDAVLFERSQAFAMAVQTGSLAVLADHDFTDTLLAEMAKADLSTLPQVDWLALLRLCVREILTSDDLTIQQYLRSLADSYTLLAFLKQTPDVQRAVEKMFSHGMLWLDATVVLPLLADTLETSEGKQGRFTRMIDAARCAGLKLFITPGILEEVERHMNRALTCVRKNYTEWEGSIPYLLGRYLGSGRPSASFSTWLENFRGDVRPLRDLADYLQEEFGVEERSLEAECQAAPDELRNALQTIWYARYDRRNKTYGGQIDQMSIAQLVSHDVECYAGVVQLRSEEGSSPFGYNAWWLTLDRHAFDLKGRLQGLMNRPPPDSPVLSADFLVNYLALGPARQRVTKVKESRLPLLMVLGSAARLTPELVGEAERIRAQLKDLPERVIRRQVRDYLDRARSRIGPIAALGMDEGEDVL